MKTSLLIGALVVLRLLTVDSAHAQAPARGLALPDLLTLGRNAVPDSERLLPRLTTLLPAAAWTYGGHIAGTPDFYWTSTPASPGQQPTFWLCLRPSQPSRDVVVKTTASDYVRQLRRTLTQRKLKPELVNSLDGEAVRYQAADFVVTLYSHKKGDYPFVVVLRQPVGTTGAPITRLP